MELYNSNVSNERSVPGLLWSHLLIRCALHRAHFEKPDGDVERTESEESPHEKESQRAAGSAAGRGGRRRVYEVITAKSNQDITNHSTVSATEPLCKTDKGSEARGKRECQRGSQEALRQREIRHPLNAKENQRRQQYTTSPPRRTEVQHDTRTTGEGGRDDPSKLAVTITEKQRQGCEIARAGNLFQLRETSPALPQHLWTACDKLARHSRPTKAGRVNASEGYYPPQPPIVRGAPRALLGAVEQARVRERGEGARIRQTKQDNTPPQLTGRVGSANERCSSRGGAKVNSNTAANRKALTKETKHRHNKITTDTQRHAAAAGARGQTHANTTGRETLWGRSQGKTKEDGKNKTKANTARGTRVREAKRSRRERERERGRNRRSSVTRYAGQEAHRRPAKCE